VSVGKAVAKKDLETGLKGIPDAASAIVKVVTGDKDLANAVKGATKIGFGIPVVTYKIVEAVNKDDKKGVLEALGEVTEAIATGFELADTVENADKSDEKKDDRWSKVGAAVSQALNAPALAGRVYLAVKNGKPSEAFAAIRDGINNGA